MNIFQIGLAEAEHNLEVAEKELKAAVAALSQTFPFSKEQDKVDRVNAAVIAKDKFLLLVSCWRILAAKEESK